MPGVGAAAAAVVAGAAFAERPLTGAQMALYSSDQESNIGGVALILQSR